MNRVLGLLVSCAMAVFALSSCKRSAQSSSESATAPAQRANQRVFLVKGIVKALRPERNEIEIKHEEIPDYMPSMTMPFEVKDTNELSGLEPGQSISFRLTVTETEGWVDDLKPLGRAPEESSTNSTATQPIRVVEELKVGQPLPEFHLTNELGQAVTTTQFKGQALAITFLFTRCPFPTFCPRLANDFAETQEKMLNLQGGPANWHLLTVSFDPDFDRPAVLKSYALAHHYDPAHSTFATGDLDDVTALGDLFGLVFWRDSTGSITHNMRTAVIDAHGRLQKVFEGKDWTSAELAAELVKAARS
ncbi:MAG TPA: SCO family protein [Verrucomicrobiae bacterium]|nr:SCO family protein [Verrucomicrobiae bacterium]